MFHALQPCPTAAPEVCLVWCSFIEERRRLRSQSLTMWSSHGVNIMTLGLGVTTVWESRMSGHEASESSWISGPQPFWDRFHGRRFFHGLGWECGWREWFQGYSSTLHLSCTLFPLLWHQLHLRSSGIRSQRLGTPSLPLFSSISKSIEIPLSLFSLVALGEVGAAVAAAKSLQLCPTLCDPIDGSPTGSSVPGILQARTLEWVAISFSNAWKWKVKVKSLSRVRL